MHNENALRRKMPFFDTFKTTAAVGLLMHQASAMYCPEVGRLYDVPYGHNLSAEDNRQARDLMMNEALCFIKGLTKTLNKAYALLLNSAESERDFCIKQLDPVQTDLIELQLRGLEGAIKNVYNGCAEDKRQFVKAPLLVIAQARASAAKLNHLINQMTKPVEVFVSSIDKDALRALAKHGTEVFVSGRFH
ncbi:hypothetical protein [Yersinia proxima]|uniref:hypothetical protein n=1 Tax=Yersinia proxima TaxID=2890316 RepID=UPI001D129378|nr:hypothetical protein [Yersinia proxima]